MLLKFKTGWFGFLILPEKTSSYKKMIVKNHFFIYKPDVLSEGNHYLIHF